MGISADAAAGEITIEPCLPQEIEDVKLYDLKFGEYSIDILVEKDKVILKKK